MTEAQKAALKRVAKAQGWDEWSLRDVEILAWAAFQYLVIRLNGES